MALREELEQQGNWLFRRRSYVPLLFIPILIIALRNADGLEIRVGETVDDIWKLSCLMLSFAGLAIRAFAVGCAPAGTSGRNTKKQIANTLNSTGAYSVVRHPLYLGNALIALGAVLSIEVWWLAVIYILGFWIYYERIMYAEEAFLASQFGERYTEWAARTPAFIPNLRLWQPPALPLSLRNVLRREYTGFYVIISVFTFLEVVGDGLAEGVWQFDAHWITVFSLGTAIYLTLMTLKRKTNLLYVEGR